MRFLRLAFGRSPVGWGVVLFGLVALLQQLERLQVPVGAVTATTTGIFPQGAPISSNLPPPFSLRLWSSWAGSDNHRGSLVLGPIATPRFSIWAIGYPQIGKNRVTLENLRTGATYDLALANIGDVWARHEIHAPEEWRDEPVALHLTDDAAEWGGWIGVSEPFNAPPVLRWWTPRMHRIADVLLVGVTLLVWLHASAFVLRWMGFGSEPALPLLAAAFTAVVGLALFWIYFAHHRAGLAATWLAHAGAIVLSLLAALRSDRTEARGQKEFGLCIGITMAIGLFYAAALHGFVCHRIVSDLASHRFSEWLPNDNEIPQHLAENLRLGLALKPFHGDWLSSDRPPLQAGWTLLFVPPAELLQSSYDTVAQCAGLWFQMLWVPAGWLWLRAVGATRSETALLLTALTPCGFLFLNSVYVWPKLGSAGLAIGAFVLWFLLDREIERRRRFAAGAALAALGWLGHGGVAFSFLALVPLIFVRLRRDGVASWATAAVAFALLAVPWMAYQKFYDPPGNRLLKWHLAGVIPPDQRGTLETLRQSYAEQPWTETWRVRRLNTRLQFAGDWRSLATLSFANPQAQRIDEFSSTFYALRWWNLGFGALALGWAIPSLRRRWSHAARNGVLLSVGWVLLTLAVWVALMFQPGGASIHQGSYAVLLTLLAALALALLRLHWGVVVAVCAVQAFSFAMVWMDPPAVLGRAPVATDSVVVMVLAAAAMVAVTVRAWRHERARQAEGAGVGPSIHAPTS